MTFPSPHDTCARPSCADWSEGWQIARETYGERADYGAAHHFACAVMQKRQGDEWRVRAASFHRKDAA